MKTLIGLLAVLMVTAGSAAAQEHRFYVDVGVGLITLYTDQAVIQVNGKAVPGAGASIEPNFAVGAAFGIFLSEHWAASVLVGIPPTATVTANGTLASFGQLGKLKYGPMTVTVHRHFFFGPVQPYIGGGVGVLKVLSTEDGALSNLTVSDSVGPALNAGTQIVFSKHFALYLDFKQIWLDTTAQGFRGPIIIRAEKVPLNPRVWSSGITLLF